MVSSICACHKQHNDPPANQASPRPPFPKFHLIEAGWLARISVHLIQPTNFHHGKRKYIFGDEERARFLIDIIVACFRVSPNHFSIKGEGL